MDTTTEIELCDYLQVRHAKMEPPPSPPQSGPPKTGASVQQEPATLPSKLYKHWTPLWVVLNVEISPNYSYIGYCKKESDWLIDSQTIAKCFLGATFKVERLPPGYSKKYDNVLQLIFKGYKLDLGFDSMTKLDQWYKALVVISERHHVDLVRCHEHPELEGEYVVQVCPSSFLIWNPEQKASAKPSWEWQLKHIRRVHWHKNLNKLEVEPGRSSGTGEGHFYFTGHHSYRLFRSMKHMMSTHSQVGLTPTRSDPELHGVQRVKAEKEGGSGSETDWTGTGDDWTGTSNDSVFINYIRSKHTELSRFASPGASPSPPPPPPRVQSEEVYTNLNPLTLNQDNTYCSINTTLVARNKSPSPRPPATTMPDKFADSLTDDDGYCKMMISNVNRAGLKEVHPTPVGPGWQGEMNRRTSNQSTDSR